MKKDRIDKAIDELVSGIKFIGFEDRGKILMSFVEEIDRKIAEILNVSVIVSGDIVDEFRKRVFDFCLNDDKISVRMNHDRFRDWIDECEQNYKNGKREYESNYENGVRV